MRKTLFAFVSMAALIGLPSLGSAQDGSGVAAGAATGAVGGAIVGGPVGAAVGAGVGAAAGGAAEAANRPNTVVVEPRSTGSVSQRTTTCVEGAASSQCTETEVRR